MSAVHLFVDVRNQVQPRHNRLVRILQQNIIVLVYLYQRPFFRLGLLAVVFVVRFSALFLLNLLDTISNK